MLIESFIFHIAKTNRKENKTDIDEWKLQKGEFEINSKKKNNNIEQIRRHSQRTYRCVRNKIAAIYINITDEKLTLSYRIAIEIRIKIQFSEKKVAADNGVNPQKFIKQFKFNQ